MAVAPWEEAENSEGAEADVCYLELLFSQSHRAMHPARLRGDQAISEQRILIHNTQPSQTQQEQCGCQK